MRDRAPSWRTLAGLEVVHPAALLVGDPGRLRGPTRVPGVTVTPGTWRWEVRDDATLVWAARLRRAEVPVQDDWPWWDPYGDPLPEPRPDTTVIDLGVGSGVVDWLLVGPQGPPVLGDAAGAGPRVLAGGWGMRTPTGRGEGVYPLAVRRRDGEVVELRAEFLSPEPEPLDLDRAAALLPGVFTDAWLDHAGVAGLSTAVALDLIRTTRPAEAGVEHRDTVRLMELVDLGLRLPSADDPVGQELESRVLARFDHLWNGLAPTDRDALAVAWGAEEWQEQPWGADQLLRLTLAPMRLPG